MSAAAAHQVLGGLGRLEHHELAEVIRAAKREARKAARPGERIGDYTNKRGRWAGEYWICGCRGSYHDGHESECIACRVKRPAMRYLLKQSLENAESAKVARVNAANAYVRGVELRVTLTEGLSGLLDWMKSDGYTQLRGETLARFRLRPEELS